MAVFLAGASIAKLATGYSQSYVISWWMYYGIAACELLLFVTVFVRPKVSAGLVLLLCIGGLIIDVIYPKVSCGCLGALEMDRRSHWMIIGTLGLLATIVLNSGSKDDPLR